MNHTPSKSPGTPLESPTLPLPPPREAAGYSGVGTSTEDALAIARQIRQAGSPHDGSRPIGHGIRTEPPGLHAERLTPSLITHNDRSVLSPSLNLLGFDRFLPELAGQKPDALLKVLTE